jgi:uncharacterized membrane protein
MTKATDSKVSTPYINNPFFVAVEGIRRFFTLALGAAILLVILSANNTFNANSFPPTTPVDDPSASAPAETVPGPDMFNEPATWAVIGLIALVILAIVAAIGTVVAGISYYSAARISHGQTATFKEAWQATRDNFWPFFWLQILTVLKLIAWSLLFIVPGFIMYYRYSLANISFFDKGLRGNAAIKDSVALTKGSWITTYASQTLFTFVSLGTLSTLVTVGASAILYRQFNAVPLDKRPKTHDLSVATLVLSLLFVAFVVIALSAALVNYALTAV